MRQRPELLRNTAPPHIVNRNILVVEIETGVRCLADIDVEALMSWKRLSWQRKKQCALVGEGITNLARGVLDPFTLGGSVATPIVGLSIEVGDVGILAGSEEGIAHIANSSLDATFLVAPSDGDRARLEAVVSSELKQPWIEA